MRMSLATPGHSLTTAKPKTGSSTVGWLGQDAAVDGVDEGAGDLELHPRTGAVAAAAPAGVDQPDVGLVLGHLGGQAARRI